MRNAGEVPDPESSSDDWTSAVKESPVAKAAGNVCIDGNNALVGARVIEKRARMIVPAERTPAKEDP